MAQARRLASFSSRCRLRRDVVQRGIAAERLARALEAYRRREVSLGRAAEMAHLPITVFMDEVARAGILRDYDVEDMRQDLEWAASS